MHDDKPVALSESCIWELQRAYFERAGMDAWRHDVVPSYITTNPFIADCYARLARAFVDDLGAGDGPLTVIELGAGSGRFAHHFLRAFRPAAASGLRYVMTDIAQANIDFWQAHERLAPWFASGQLAARRLDVSDPGADAAWAGMLGGGGPVIVVANYFLDGIAQDLFEVRDGKLHELFVQAAQDAAAPAASLDDLRLRHRRRACRRPRYRDPALASLLDMQAAAIRNGSFPFPVEALRLLDAVRRQAAGPVLLLAADKGVVKAEELESRRLVQPAAHGSVSYAVDFSAIASHVRRAGGRAWLPAAVSPRLCVCAFALSEHPGEGLASTYENVIERFGPAAFASFKNGILAQLPRLALAELIGAFRVARWDAVFVCDCHDRVAELLPFSTAAERAELRAGLAEAWSGYYALGEPQDVAFRIGTLLAGAGAFDAALPVLETSIVRYGSDPATVGNIAACREQVARRRGSEAAVEVP